MNLSHPQNTGMDALIHAVQRHASDNYNTGGWDYVIETMSREDIAKIIVDENGSASVEDAIRVVGALCKLLDDRRRDITATAF